MRRRKCELCDNDSIKSSIVGDIYYRDLCFACYDNLMEHEKPTSGQADYERGRDYEDNLADIIQPFEDGKPSLRFIQLYPAQAQKMFSPEEIDQAFRS